MGLAFLHIKDLFLRQKSGRGDVLRPGKVQKYKIPLQFLEKGRWQDLGAGSHNDNPMNFVLDHARIPHRLFKERFIDTGMARKGVPAWVFQVKDPEALIPSPFIDHFLILVAGGTGEKSLLIPGWSASTPVSKEIRLPSYWADLLPSN